MTEQRVPSVTRAEGAVAARPDLLRVGTRGSTLAVAQTTTVAEQIAQATGLDVVLAIVTTQGDTSRASLSQLGGTGVFVSALRDALLAGECDFAVHSLKDLPTAPCPGVALAAIPHRADPRDALCTPAGQTLAALPQGARVGTGSPRRAAQVRAARPDLDVVDIRGNVDTRLGRAGIGDGPGDLDAVVLAAAGLDRLGRDAAIAERFPLDLVPTAPGQGALAIETREADLGDARIAAAVAALDDTETRACALAERQLLASLEAGCAAPVGARARIERGTSHPGELHLTAAVYSLDGSSQLVAEASGDPAEPLALGHAVALDLLARGAADLAPLGDTR